MDKIYEIEGIMKTDEKGNLMISSKSYFDQFFQDNPNSSFSFKVVKNSSNSKKSMIAYFYAEVLPKFILGFSELGNIISKEEALTMVMDITTIDKQDFDDLNYFELKKLINEIIIFANQNLEIIIEEPI